MAAGRSTADDFRLARAARSRYRLADLTLAPDLATARTIAARVNAEREVEPPAPALRAAQAAETQPPLTVGELHAGGVLVAILGRLVDHYRSQADPAAIAAADRWLRRRLGPVPVSAAVTAFASEFPARLAIPEQPNPPAAIVQLLLLGTLDENPAVDPFRELVDLARVRDGSRLVEVVDRLEAFFATRPKIGPDGKSLVALLREPAAAAPGSLADQLRWIRDHWAGRFEGVLDDLIDRLLVALDVLAEERLAAERAWFAAHDPGAGGPAEVYDFAVDADEPERFSADTEWMPRLVLIAKSTHVWLDQLSRRHAREIRTLDAIPDEELDQLARWGITGLWLIGLWERSAASERIKRLRGDHEAVASAYSLDDYVIAGDLGSEPALADLRSRAAARGIRLTSDMVPNHMGIDSRWVIEHPDRFLSRSDSPFPAYTFNGPDLSRDGRVGIYLEDHYYDGTDAAVVFKRVDRASGETRFVYHGNDGTSYPWNDTAQLDYSKGDVREAVIQTILAVARRFPVIRFDAAMVLARKHIQRLWFPEPGHGGAIPSRAGYGMTSAEFASEMPGEFWREVVDRVAAEVPGTLLLAEAFWLLEGYFVRTLGMHRVYNSAFMNMLRDERNAEYRLVIRNTLEFDPAILGRFVNFMSNPDERTAIDQFGSGDKYFGVAALMATLPGLPMFGHGQVEGFTEKYGMEFRRARLHEDVDLGLLEHHERTIFPLLHRRAMFAGSDGFRLYDVVDDQGNVSEDVFAYSNVGPGGERSLVVYNNRHGEAHGWIRESVGFMARQPDGSRALRRESLAEGLGLGLTRDGERYLVLRDAMTGLEQLRSAAEIAGPGLRVELGAYACHVFADIAEIADRDRPVAQLAATLGVRGVPSVEEALRRLELEPIHEPIRALLGHPELVALIREGSGPAVRGSLTESPSFEDRAFDDAVDRVVVAFGHATVGATETPEQSRVIRSRLAVIGTFAAAGAPSPGPTTPLADVQPAFSDPWHRSVLVGWATLDPISRAAFDDLRLGLALTEGLRQVGLDEDRAARAADRMRILLELPRPSAVPGPSTMPEPSAAQRRPRIGARSSASLARRLINAWLGDLDTRAFLRLNHWEGFDWLGRDEFRELLDWSLLVDAIELSTTSDVGDAAARTRALVASSEVVHRLAAAGEAAGYRVDRLTARLAGRPPSSARAGVVRGPQRKS